MGWDRMVLTWHMMLTWRVGWFRFLSWSAEEVARLGTEVHLDVNWVGDLLVNEFDPVGLDLGPEALERGGHECLMDAICATGSFRCTLWIRWRRAGFLRLP